MADPFGIREAARRGIELGNIGHKIVLENEHVRVWEVRLDPGKTIDFHIHRHPYLIVSLGGGKNCVETIFGDSFTTDEPLGATVFVEWLRPVHRLTNRANVPYLSRLIELKHIIWSPDPTEEG